MSTTSTYTHWQFICPYYWILIFHISTAYQRLILSLIGKLIERKPLKRTLVQNFCKDLHMIKTLGHKTEWIHETWRVWNLFLKLFCLGKKMETDMENLIDKQFSRKFYENTQNGNNGCSLSFHCFCFQKQKKHQKWKWIQTDPNF